MNFDAAALHLLRPQWLWALFALPALVWWWRRQRQRRSVWRENVDAHLLPHLLQGNEGARGSLWLWAMSAAFLIAVIALAGPSWRKSEQPLWQSRAPLVIALDLSSATLANDLPPSRLLQARAKIATLLRERAGGQVGLVAFADDAFTVSPLTDDTANVALFLDALAPDVMPVDGSHARGAIEESVKLLRQAKFQRGNILLITDHADIAARAAARAAAQSGFQVSVLGLGTTRGAAYRSSDGRIAQARLDTASLNALASAGDGRYAALSPGGDDLHALGVLDAQQIGTTAAQDKQGTMWLDSGYWLLPPLMLLALLAFRRGALMVIMLSVCIPWRPAHAAENALWLRADQQTHAQMQRGAEAYRKGDFNGAERAWNGLSGADAAYNRGNALARAQRYEEAIAAYDQALRAQPGMGDAIANKKAVEAAMKRKPPSGKNQNRPNQSGRNQQQQKPQSGQPQNPSQSPGQSQSGENADQSREQPDRSRTDAGDPNPGNSSPPEPSQDAQAQAAAQRRADAEQRARMQRALQQGGRQANDGQRVQGRPERAETAAERERRLANEAWLRRIPDDPGGLLRAKFRLEHERRQKSGDN